MKKRWIALSATIIVLVGLGAVGLWYQSLPPTVTLGDATFAMRVARTASERQQGLSGTSQIAADEALVFDFLAEDRWGIWMKDMNYPIDIVWLDGDKNVIHIVKDAQPSSYPTVTYRPAEPAKYVIELKAGVTSAKRITIGTHAVFDSTKGTFE